MTIISSLAKNRMAQNGEKYTEALRAVEFELLLSGYEAYRPGGKFSTEIEDLLPLLRSIKPLKFETNDDEEIVMFVQPEAPGGTNPNSGGIGFLASESWLPALDQKVETYGALEIVFDMEPKAEDVEGTYDFDTMGVPGESRSSASKVFTKVAPRVLIGESSGGGGYAKGVNGSDFAQIMTTLSKGKIGELVSYHIDLRGLSYSERVSLIADTVNNLHDPIIKVKDMDQVSLA